MDQHSVYTFDLVGNRLEKATDTDDDGTPDEVIRYAYDANDRLLVEQLDEDYTGEFTPDRTTLYEYGPNADPEIGDGGDHTTLTKTTVYSGSSSADPMLSETTNTYNVQGRLETVAIDSDGGGVDSTSTYEYDDSGIRVSKTVDGSRTEYVIDANNHTGYAQVLEEWNTDAAPVNEKTSVIGHAVLTEWGSAAGFLYRLTDAHGSTRVLTNFFGWVLQYGGENQVFTYDAYGNLIEGPTPSHRLTTLLYTGEQYDASLDQYYLRARYYDPATGRFNRLDPFAGINSDPLTLHKYLYCGANPVNAIDPTGMFEFSLLGMLTTSFITGMLASTTAGFVVAAQGGAQAQVNEAMLTWFWRGAAAGAVVYGGAWAAQSMLIWVFGPTAGYGALQHASAYGGVQSYSSLTRLLSGTGLQAHHIIEARFADTLGLKAGDMLSVAMGPEHQVFTNMWRAAVAYGTDYNLISASQLWVHAQEIYAEYPALLAAAKSQLGM